MRFVRFSVKGHDRDGVLDGQGRCIDLAAAGVPAEALPAWAAPEDVRVDRVVRAVPPREAVFAPGSVRMLPACAAQRLVVQGGRQEDLRPTVVAPGAPLPSGPWSPGVAAVVRADATDVRAASWEKHVAGWVPFHLVGTTISFGPWIVGTDEVRDFRQLMFSAFVNDEPTIRPAKALLDWGTALAAAHAAAPLRQGDLVAVAAPPRDVQAPAELRAALVVDGQVRARLVNPVGARAEARAAASVEMAEPAAPAESSSVESAVPAPPVATADAPDGGA